MVDISLCISVPERMEKEARKAGLLSQKFFRGAIEQELRRRSAAGRLVRNVARFRAQGATSLTPAEVKAEIQAVRKVRRGLRENRR